MKKILYTLLCLCLALLLCSCNMSDYKRAESYLESGNYDMAIFTFQSLGDYKDAPERIKEANYQKAEKYVSEEDYSTAIEILEELSDYHDADKRIVEVKYLKAEKLLKKESFSSAEKLYKELGDYKDSAEKLKVALYGKAEKLVEQESIEEAIEIYTSLGDFKDAKAKIIEAKKRIKVPATDVKLNKSSVTLYVGETAALKATLSPKNTTDTVKSWSSSNEKVANVDSNGVVIAVSAGSASITVRTSNRLDAKCIVVVQEKPVATTPATVYVSPQPQAPQPPQQAATETPKTESSFTSKSAFKSMISGASGADQTNALLAYDKLYSVVKFQDTLQVIDVWAFDLVNGIHYIVIEHKAENNFGTAMHKYYVVGIENGVIIRTDDETENPIRNRSFLGKNVRKLS